MGLGFRHGEINVNGRFAGDQAAAGDGNPGENRDLIDSVILTMSFRAFRHVHLPDVRSQPGLGQVGENRDHRSDRFHGGGDFCLSGG
jgi:hypothetical protein